MILLDTSGWVDYLRGTPGAAKEHVRDLIRQGAALAVTEPIVMELLAGAPDDRALERLEALVSGLPLLAVDPHLDYRDAAAIYRSARRSRWPASCGSCGGRMGRTSAGAGGSRGGGGEAGGEGGAEGGVQGAEPVIGNSAAGDVVNGYHPVVPSQPDDPIADRPSESCPRGDGPPSEVLRREERRFGAARLAGPAGDLGTREARMADDVDEFYRGARAPLSDVTAGVYGVSPPTRYGADDGSHVDG